MPLVRPLWSRLKLVAAAALGLASFFLLPHGWELPTRALMAWNLFIILYLALIVRVLMGADSDDIEERAAQQDEGRIAVLLATLFTVIASLVGIVAELSGISEMGSRDANIHVALVGATVLLSWLFMHTMFGIHYAHEYYDKEGDTSRYGLDFPGDEEPDYWDFIHFSYVIGVACQTADIQITSRVIRRVVTLHGMAAFFYNTTVLALTVNIGASLIG